MEQAQAASRKDDCSVLQKIAKAPLQYADEPLFAALAGCGLAMDFPIEDLQLDDTGFKYPCFPPKPMLESLASQGHFHKLLGMPVAYSDVVLPRFWDKYERLFPQHEFFETPIDRSHLLPFYLHGDGGRTYKKDSIMILSMYSAFGEGTAKKHVELQPVPGQKRKRPASGMGDIEFEPGVNLGGNTYSNRFLFAAMKSQPYKKKHERFESLISHWGQYLKKLFREGFTFNNERWYIAILGVTGDAPFLRECGNHNRSFSNVRKSAESKADLLGVCWLCDAGRTGGPPFEDFRIVEALWTQNCGRQNPLPWIEPGRLLEHLPTNDSDLAAFYKPDLFHVYHSGLGKDFTASSLVYLLKSVYKQRNIKDSVVILNDNLKVFLKESREHLHFGRITLELLGYSSSRSYPYGHWSKNMDTATMSKFVEYICLENLQDYRGDPIFGLILEACAAIGQFMHVVFSADFFLSETEAWQLIASGQAFLLQYSKLASLTYDAKMCLFALKPKGHVFAHIIHTALQQFRVGTELVINPIAESTFMCEDFVGKVARLSRRVSAKQQGKKTMMRYMVAVCREIQHASG